VLGWRLFFIEEFVRSIHGTSDNFYFDCSITGNCLYQEGSTQGLTAEYFHIEKALVFLSTTYFLIFDWTKIIKRPFKAISKAINGLFSRILWGDLQY
jgi:hypothetical protein